jgi:hypothetical protein
MLLYHFSEDPNIKIFEPRIIDGQKQKTPLVWAVDEEHSINYYFPRECPRIIYCRTNETTEEDNVKFFGNTIYSKIITIENEWIEKINNVILYKYIFEDKTFELNDIIAGYYVSKKTVKPKDIEKMCNLFLELKKKNVEIRMTPNLYPLRDEILKSNLSNYSIIRFRNAKEIK